MPFSPWNWVWSAATLVLWWVTRRRPAARAVAAPFVACIAVAAGLAWTGVGGIWHLAFPVLPPFLLAASRLRAAQPAPVHPEVGTVSVAHARPARSRPRPRPRRRTRPDRPTNPVAWSEAAWWGSAAAALVVLVLGVESMEIVALLVPGAPAVATALWRPLARRALSPTTDVAMLATVIAVEVGLAVVAVAVPDPVPVVYDTAATPVAVTTTTVPFVLPTSVAGGGDESVVYVSVIGTVAQFTGGALVVPVEGAFVTLDGGGPARFTLTDSQGRAAFVVGPGIYTVTVVPPGNRWSVMRGCRDVLQSYPVAAGEEWTWRVRLVDDGAAQAYGAVGRCATAERPTPGRGF